MDVISYLKRLNYQGPLAPTAETLHALHYSHVLAVPFENLDIHLRRPIVLDEEYLFAVLQKYFQIQLQGNLPDGRRNAEPN
jgi:arylamine N-acetyltransferase